jgi:hypothetical protein
MMRAGVQRAPPPGQLTGGGLQDGEAEPDLISVVGGAKWTGSEVAGLIVKRIRGWNGRWVVVKSASVCPGAEVGVAAVALVG